ncbi:MAG: glycosyltransferase [Chloroflexota bacterium]
MEGRGARGVDRARTGGIVVAGMHHSGTSAVAAILAAGGWDPGAETVPPDPVTGRHYLEEAGFVALHRAWIGATLPAGRGHADWGLSDGGPLDLARLPADAPATAAAYLRSRNAAAARWLAKDPRASLFLDTWAAAGSPLFVLVYRASWDVADSCVRLGHPSFVADPGRPRAAWRTYNAALLAFAVAHSARCLLVAAETAIADPAALIAAVAERAGSATPQLPPDAIDPARFTVRAEGSAIARVARTVHPELGALLDALDARADLPRPRPAPGPVAPRPLAGGAAPDGAGVQVIVPCRDDGAFLDEAIASVDAAVAAVAASGAPFPVELTIVDDGSADPETLRILALLRADGRQVIAGPGVGLAAARNAGAAVSRTAALLPLDADNRIRPTLLLGAQAVLSGTADIVHGPWRCFGLARDAMESPTASWGAFLPGNRIDACAVIRRAVVEEHGGWDPRLPAREDWDHWLGAWIRGRAFARVPETTVDYLVRPGSLTERTGCVGIGSRPDLHRTIVGKAADLLRTRAAALAGVPADALQPDGRRSLERIAAASAAGLDAIVELWALVAHERRGTGVPDDATGALRADLDGMRAERDAAAAGRATAEAALTAARAELAVTRAELDAHRFRPSVATRAAVRTAIPALSSRVVRVIRRPCGQGRRPERLHTRTSAAA